MSATTALSTSPPAQFAGATHPESRSKTWPGFAQIAATLAGLTLVGAACMTNATYALKRAGDDVALQIILVAVAASVSVLLALSLTATIRALGSRQWTTAATCFSAFALCGVFSVSAALGSQSSVRVEAAASVAERNASLARAQSALDRATVDLAALPASRTIGEIDADLRKLAMRLPPQTDCLGWVNNKTQRTWCVDRHRLEGEHSIATRRMDLETAVKDARNALDKLTGAGPSQANSDAATISRFLSAAGYDVEPDRVADWLVVLSVLILECGGSAALVVASALAPVRGSQRLEHDPHDRRAGDAGVSASAPVAAVVDALAVSWRSTGAAADVSPESVTAVPIATAKTPRQPSRSSNVRHQPGRKSGVVSKVSLPQEVVAAKVIELASRHDGTVPGSTRGLTRLIEGSSKSSVHRAIAALVASGTLMQAGDGALILASRAAA